MDRSPNAIVAVKTPSGQAVRIGNAERSPLGPFEGLIVELLEFDAPAKRKRAA